MSRSPAPARPPCRLYLITPSAAPDLAALVARLEAALGGGDVAAVQLRLKGAEDDAVLAAARAIRPAVERAGAALIMNDRPDLAAKSGCDGVHVGLTDASIGEARRIMGSDAMIGATCHDSRHLAMEAAEAGADYVAFGAFHPSTTKAAVHRPDASILGIWQETMEIPCVAIGGITAGNAAALARAGADFVAVSAAVWDDPEGPGAAVAALNRALADAA